MASAVCSWLLVRGPDNNAVFMTSTLFGPLSYIDFCHICWYEDHCFNLVGHGVKVLDINDFCSACFKGPKASADLSSIHQQSVPRFHERGAGAGRPGCVHRGPRRQPFGSLEEDCQDCISGSRETRGKGRKAHSQATSVSAPRRSRI